MKTKNHFIPIFGTILVLSIVLLSCSTSKKTAISCPVFSINKNNKIHFDHKKNRNKILAVHHSVNTKKQPLSLSKRNHGKDIVVFRNSPEQDKIKVPGVESVSYMNKIEYSEGLIASIDNVIIPFERNRISGISRNKIDITEQLDNLIITQSAGCDTIVLKTGSILIGKVEEIGQNEIKYRRCNNLTGPIISISRSDVSMILYTNGTHEILTTTYSPITDNNNATYTDNSAIVKTEGFGIAGFVSSLVGLFVAGIPLGLIGVIFGGISLNKIKKNPGKLKGRGLAVASIIIGIIAIVGAIIVLASV